MPFSRLTLSALAGCLECLTAADLDRLILTFAIEKEVQPGSGTKPHLANKVIRYLADHSESKGPRGAAMEFELAEELLGRLQGAGDAAAALLAALRQDGFVWIGGSLIRDFPVESGSANRASDLERLLDQFGFTTARGHLEQARAAHARRDWAAANAQTRTFLESLFDNIAEVLIPDAAIRYTSSHARRQALSTITPPFFEPQLNEWRPDGSGFVSGLWQRLHPQGSHPGLSDEEDSSLRLALGMLVGHHYLRRLEDRPK